MTCIKGLKVVALSEYMIFGFSFLEISLISSDKHLINSVALRFDTNSKCTAVLKLHKILRLTLLLSVANWVHTANSYAFKQQALLSSISR